jgi:hypothetical protein
LSISLYYTARRRESVSPSEQAAISDLIARYSIDKEIESFQRTQKGPNWESFCIYDPTNPSESDVIFEGATKLPDKSEEAIWTGLQHWCRLLSEIRRALPEASWHVHVDDHDLEWNSEREQYDLRV